MSALLLIGCGTQKTKHAENGEQSKTGALPEKVVYDTKKPTNFEAYKQWRQHNDPNSEAYAEFKAWEIKQREWKVKNEQ